MINDKNKELFNLVENPLKIVEAKHAFYFELNRSLSRLDKQAKVLYIGFRIESVLHEACRELNEEGLHTTLEYDHEAQEMKLRILLKD